MKGLITTAVFVALFSVCHGIIFSGSVRDLLIKNIRNKLMKRNCAACKDTGGVYCKNYGCAGNFRFICAKTCGTCKSCEEYGITPATSTAEKKIEGRAGEAGGASTAALEPPGCKPGCADQYPDFCPLYKQQGKCSTYQFICPETCGVCVPCTSTGASQTGQGAPDAQAGQGTDATATGGATGGASVKTSSATGTTPIPCTLDCRDARPSCSAWGLQGHCNPQGAYPDTIVACQQTCKACRKCVLPKPATIVNLNAATSQ